MRSEPIYAAIAATSATMSEIVNDAPQPEVSRACLMAMLGMVTVKIRDEVWERVKEEAYTPCGRISCTCHETTGDTIMALDLLRTESKETKRKAEEGIE